MKKKLLFVCVENSNRSQMSQALQKFMEREGGGVQCRKQAEWHCKSQGHCCHERIGIRSQLHTIQNRYRKFNNMLHLMR